MKNYTILKATLLPKEKVMITVSGHRESIFRTHNQFLRELKGSNILPEGVNSLNNPLVQPAMRGLTGGTVFGEIAWYDKGTKYEITEGHPALTKGHDLYGQVNEGDVLERDTAGFYLERGHMLTYIPNALWEQNQAIAAATQFKSSIEDLFTSVNKSSEDKDDSKDNDTATPEKAFDETTDAQKQIADQAPVNEEDNEVQLTPAQKRAATKAAKKAAEEA